MLGGGVPPSDDGGVGDVASTGPLGVVLPQETRSHANARSRARGLGCIPPASHDAHALRGGYHRPRGREG